MTGSLNDLEDYLIAYYNLELLISQPSEYEKQKNKSREVFETFQNQLDIRMAAQETEQKLKFLVRTCATKLASYADDFQRFYEINLTQIEQSLATFKDLFSEIKDKLFELYQYLRNSSSDSFNSDVAIPKAFYGMIDCQAHPGLVQKLKEKQIDEALYLIISDFLNPGSLLPTFRIQTWLGLNYFKRVNDALLSFANQSPTANDTLMLIKVLVRKNFNSDAFYEYMIAYVDGLSAQNTAYEDQEIDLCRFGDFIEKVRQIKNLGFNLEVPTIQESIGMLVENGKKRIRELNKDFIQNGAGGAKKKRHGLSWKYLGDFTELMFFLRVVVAINIIDIKSWSSLYYDLSQHSSSRRSKSPSVGHLRNQNVKEEDVSPKVVKKVVENLKLIIAHIEKNYKSQLRF